MQTRTVHVPAKLNTAALVQFEERVASVLSDPQTQALVLRGTEQGFCEGLDLDVLHRREEERTQAVHLFATILARLRHAPVFTLAHVAGAARGGGVGLAAVADWVVATSDAEFALPELRLGLLPATILPALLDRMRPAVLRQFALAGTSRDASWAVTCGLADEVVTEDTVEAVIRRRVREMSRAAPERILDLRALLDAALTSERNGAILAGGERTAADVTDDRITEPIARFMAGGPAPWERG